MDKFHGTSEDAVNAIIKGFKLPNKTGLYGKRVYFASDSSKSAQEIYTKGSNTLLLCKIALGKTYTVEGGQQNMTLEKLTKHGYDSLFAKRGTRETGGVKFDEFVVYRPNKAIPKYILHYEAAKTDSILNRASLLPVGRLFICHSSKQKREFDPNDPLDTHYRIAESHFLRLINKSNRRFTIKTIDYYENRLVKFKFDKKSSMEAAGKNSTSILAFHETRTDNVEGIMKENFKLELLSKTTGDRGYFGAGIYFSGNPKTSLGYGKVC